jgi:hypothetical protein
MFLIGEFSKISRVSKRLLHHYDDIGFSSVVFWTFWSHMIILEYS